MKTANLFVTCLIEAARPEAGMAVVSVLEKLGWQVAFDPAQTCCGQPAYNGGAWDEARAMARHTLDVLARSEGPIIVPSGSCADMIARHYPELFAGDAKYGPLAQAISLRVFEFAQFLADEIGMDEVRARLHPQFEGAVTYHPSCHLLRGMKIDEQPRKLLALAEKAQFTEMPAAAECCGFGGLFAIKMSEISGAMLARKLANIEQTNAQTVVGCDVSCLLNISGGLHRRGESCATKHLAEILDS